MAYPTDLTDTQWDVIKDIFKIGNRAKHSKRVLINGVFYLIKTGCQWKMLPKDYPPYSTVHSFYRRARINGLWADIVKRLVSINRVLMGRDQDPTYALIDSQSVKTTGASDEMGIDGGKKNQRSQTSHCYRYSRASFTHKRP